MRRMATLLPSPMLKKKPSGLLKGKKTHTEATKDDGGGKSNKTEKSSFCKEKGSFSKGRRIREQRNENEIASKERQSINLAEMRMR